MIFSLANLSEIIFRFLYRTIIFREESFFIFRFAYHFSYYILRQKSFSISDSPIGYYLLFRFANHFSFIVISHAMIYYCASNHYSNTYVTLTSLRSFSYSSN